jgi:hypothetical protein
MSSAFVPSAVLNRMQESHYLEAGPSTSHVKKIVEPPAPTPAPAIVIGGLSRAPVRHAAPVYLAIEYHILEGCNTFYAVCVRVKLHKSSLQHGERVYAPEEGRCLTHCRTTSCYAQNSGGAGQGRGQGPWQTP